MVELGKCKSVNNRATRGMAIFAPKLSSRGFLHVTHKMTIMIGKDQEISGESLILVFFQYVVIHYNKQI